MAKSFTASDTSAALLPLASRSLRAALAACLLAALGAFACGGQAGQDGVASNGGAPGSGGKGQSSSGTGAAQAGGSTTSGGAGASGGTTSVSGGSTSAGTKGDSWTLPHTSDKSWRNSKEPLCNPAGTGVPHDLWSDERGVFVLSDTGTGEFSVSFNGGNGWSSVPHAQPTFFGITGFRDGPLVLFASDRCGVMFGSDGDERCVAALPGVSSVFVDDTRTFAVAGNRVLYYNGSYFTQYGKPLPGPSAPRLIKLWADAQVMLALTDEGSLYSFTDSESEAVLVPLPVGEQAFSLWAFSRDDIWVGLAENRLAHYDGLSWTVQRLGLACGNVNTLWGSDGVLFAASSSFVGKVENGEVQAFAEASRCPPDTWTVGQFEELGVRKIWGNSPSEVFFAVTERWFQLVDDGMSLQTIVTDPDACGMQRLYWYDGERLRPL